MSLIQIAQSLSNTARGNEYSHETLRAALEIEFLDDEDRAEIRKWGQAHFNCSRATLEQIATKIIDHVNAQLQEQSTTASPQFYTSKKVLDEKDGTYRLLTPQGELIAVKNVRTGNRNWWTSDGVLIRDSRIIEAYNAAPVTNPTE